MIYFDTTQSRRGSHPSGLRRVNRRLLEELGGAVAVAWDERSRGWRTAGRGERAEPGRGDWWLTTEVFSPAERAGFPGWLDRCPVRRAAVFHDAIPLRFPEITWPRSVARHPAYLKMLAGFDRVWAVSEASRRDLLGWWRWQGVAGASAAGAGTPPARDVSDRPSPPVDVLPLGADASAGSARRPAGGMGRALVCLGIIEPRKNQEFLLAVAERLWAEGADFDLWFFGRVNPHFGRPIVRALRASGRRQPRLHYEAGADDARVREILQGARALLFPTLAEGCGLPLLESLWNGIPCVASDLPPLRENAAGGGCLLLPVNAVEAWTDGLRRLLADATLAAGLRREAETRVLPTWSEAAGIVRRALAD